MFGRGQSQGSQVLGTWLEIRTWARCCGSISAHSDITKGDFGFSNCGITFCFSTLFWKQMRQAHLVKLRLISHFLGVHWQAIMGSLNHSSIFLLTNFGSVKYLGFQTSIDLAEGAHCALKGASCWTSIALAACDRVSSGGHTQHDLHFQFFLFWLTLPMQVYCIMYSECIHEAFSFNHNGL